METFSRLLSRDTEPVKTEAKKVDSEGRPGARGICFLTQQNHCSEEPDAGNLLVRVCGGAARQLAALPGNCPCCTGPRVSWSGSQQRDMRQGECVTPCRGLSPWQVIQRFALELGRAIPLLREASNKLTKGKAEVWWYGSRTNS